MSEIDHSLSFSCSSEILHIWFDDLWTCLCLLIFCAIDPLITCVFKCLTTFNLYGFSYKHDILLFTVFFLIVLICFSLFSSICHVYLSYTWLFLLYPLHLVNPFVTVAKKDKHDILLLFVKNDSDASCTHFEYERRILRVLMLWVWESCCCWCGFGWVGVVGRSRNIVVWWRLKT